MIANPQHHCRESGNPRRQGYCDCGLRMQASEWVCDACGEIQSWNGTPPNCENCGQFSFTKHVAGPKPTRRVLELEREFTEEAARGFVDPQALITHAETRSKALCGEYVVNPMDIAPGRDRLLESLEELTDTRNHIVFCVQENLGNEVLLTELKVVLAYVTIAYDRLAKLRSP